MVATYRWSFAVRERLEDAIELELGIDILLLSSHVGRHVDRFGSHVARAKLGDEIRLCSRKNSQREVRVGGRQRDTLGLSCMPSCQDQWKLMKRAVAMTGRRRKTAAGNGLCKQVVLAGIKRGAVCYGRAMACANVKMVMRTAFGNRHAGSPSKHTRHSRTSHVYVMTTCCSPPPCLRPANWA